MKFLIIAALVAVASAAPQGQFVFKQPINTATYAKPAVVATITKTVTKPVTYQVPVATVVRDNVHLVESVKSAQSFQTYQPVQQTYQPVQQTYQPVQQTYQQAVQQVQPLQYTSAAKQIAQPVVAILKLERSQEPSGDYSYFYQAENGIQASEKAVIKSIRDEKNEEQLVPNVEGSYSYTGPDGVVYTVNYVADEFGFRASGAHLPVPPAIPEEIQRSLQLNAQQQK